MSTERDPETDQPLPTKNEHPVIQQLIITEVMQGSLDLGRRKYGTGLQPFNGRDPLLDLEEELRDALVYARQVRWERDNPPVTDGLKELRDALLTELWDHSEVEGARDLVERMLEAGPIAKAVSTIRREAFERGSSPAVGVLLAEIQDSGPGNYRLGLERAVTLLTEAHVAKHHDAYKRGYRAGQADQSNST